MNIAIMGARSGTGAAARCAPAGATIVPVSDPVVACMP